MGEGHNVLRYKSDLSHRDTYFMKMFLIFFIPCILSFREYFQPKHLLCIKRKKKENKLFCQFIACSTHTTTTTSSCITGTLQIDLVKQLLEKNVNIQFPERNSNRNRGAKLLHAASGCSGRFSGYKQQQQLLKTFPNFLTHPNCFICSGKCNHIKNLT